MLDPARHRTRAEPHPQRQYADRIRLIFERRGTGHPWIEAQVYVGGAWSPIFSLKTTDRQDALFKSVEALREREALHARGKPQPARSAPKPPENTFGEVADELLNGLIDERDELARRLGKSSGKVNTIATHISTIKTKLIPAFKDVPVPALTRAMLNEWAREQKVEARRGPQQGQMVKPGQSTIGSWNHSLQKVLDRAVEKGWIKEDDKPAISQKGFAKAQPNPSLTFAEVEALRDHMTDAWVARGGGRMWEQEASVEVRYLLRAYIALGTCTGIRAGEELELVMPRQVVFEKRGAAGEQVRVPILAHQGKYGVERTAFVYMNDAFDVPAVLRDLLRWREGRGMRKDAPLFAMPSTGRCPNFAPPFKRLLEEAGILVDPRTGLDRVPYSMRHYYATRAIVRGVTYEKLEKQMGTSADMLRKHYDHADIMAHAAELSGHNEAGSARHRSTMLRRKAAADRQDPHRWHEEEARLAGMGDQPDMSEDYPAFEAD